MRKFYIVGLIVIATLVIGLVYAEQMTLTTYYPAPSGVYNDMAVMNKLGIGTTTPDSAIDLNGAFSVRGLAAAPAVAPAGQGRIYFDTASNKFKVSEDGGAYTDLAGGSGAAFWAANGNHIYNTNSGNVGIGTANPSRQLQVRSGNTDFVANFRSSDRFAAIYVTDTMGNGYLHVDGNEPFVALGMNCYVHSTDNLIIKMNGNVGLGTTNPDPYKLYVNGTVAHQGLTDVCSKRFKKDIEYLSMTDYQTILKNIKQMNLARFRYKEEDSDSRRTIGIIAEDAPEGLLSDDSMGIDAITYASYSIAAIKVLQEEIEQLKAEIEALKGNI